MPSGEEDWKWPENNDNNYCFQKDTVRIIINYKLTCISPIFNCNLGINLRICCSMACAVDTSVTPPAAMASISLQNPWVKNNNN